MTEEMHVIDKVKLATGGELTLFSPIDMSKLPAFLKRKFMFIGSVKNELEAAKSRAACESVLDLYIEKLWKSLLATNRGYHQVNVRKGKTDKSKKVEIQCFAGDTDTKVTSSFYVPASIITLTQDGNSGYLPAYFVRKKLDELQTRSRYSSQKYKRIPITQSRWPGEMKRKLREALHDQLPAAHEFEILEEVRKKKLAMRKSKRLEEESKEAKLTETRQLESARKAARHKQHLAKLEQYHDVTAKWSKSVKRADGSYDREEFEAENVSIFISAGKGKLAYVVFKDGEEVRVARENLKFNCSS